MLRHSRVVVPAVLAAGLLLGGCSEEVDGTASPATTASPTASPPTSPAPSPTSSPTASPGGEFAEFCTEGEELFGEAGEALTEAEGMGVEALVDALDQTVAAFDALEAPDEIAEDWQASRDGFVEVRDAVAAIDPAAPDAEQQALEVIAQAETTVGPAFERVSTWIDQNCPEA
ncbi:hypothetical protein [Trujillonella humicola]|uniref:hypothetical protein n=1 Tax=Trujillonella humicola TaxID=3383699 RepID=UPI003906720B